MKKIYSLLLLVISSVSFGQVLTDSFSYPDSSLLTDNGWALTGSSVLEPIDVGVSNGLLYAGYNTVASNAARLDNNGQDLNKAFAAPVTTGTLYYSFLVKVTAASDGYFAHLITGTTTFFSKVFVRPSATAGKINFGVANSNTASWSTTDYDLDATYLIILKYEVSGAGPVSLWVKSSGVPATEAAAGTPDATATGSGSATVAGVALRQFNAAQNITVDEIKVYTTWFGATPCALSLGTETATCDAVTVNIDTYNVNIPFTGGGTGTYNLSVNAGTLGGANPSSQADGDIIITNVPEGTNVTLTVSGACGFTKTVISPECKPVNALPYRESFPYAAGTSLGSTQKWTNVNTGDNIIAATGSLNYPGFTSSDNSITFSGTGIDCFTPFTSTTSGAIYASFIMNVTDLANVTATTTDTYFAGLTDPAKSYRARIFTKVTTGQYQLGLDTASTTTNYDTTLRNPNDIVFVVMGYDFTANTLNAWINPNLGTLTAATPPTLTVTPAAPITDLGGFILRQDAANNTPTIIFDELRVATTLTGLLSVNQNTAIAGLKMYPNPVSNGTLFIETTANAEKTVAIYDVLGKQVLNTTTVDSAINVSALHTGVYIVNITEEGKTASRKLVIR
ncbi:T9SS type A sorting domain-containing protein [Flavobacterium sp.]